MKKQLPLKIQEKFIQKITGLTKEQLFLNKPKLSLREQEKLVEYIFRYNNWEPLEYILKQAEFYSLNFFVDERVLIPRVETEIIVSQVLKLYNYFDSIYIDVWTWSACIPISVNINSNFISQTYAIDISKDSLDVAKLNISKYFLDNKIKILKWNLLEPLLVENFSFLKWKSFFITANLPYIKNKDFKNINTRTFKYEPDIALYWGNHTWFELYEKLINHCLSFKFIYEIKNLILFIEISFDQNHIAETFLKNKSLKFEFFKDTNKIHRVIKIIF